MVMTAILDPTSEQALVERERLARPATLEGLTVGLLDISKPRGDIFLNRIEERLVGIGANVKRYAKPTFAKPAPVDLRHQIATECQVVIEALAIEAVARRAVCTTSTISNCVASRRCLSPRPVRRRC